MSLHIVPEPLPPLALRVLNELTARGPQDVPTLVSRVLKPRIDTDADWLIKEVLKDLCGQGLVKTNGQRYWVVP